LNVEPCRWDPKVEGICQLDGCRCDPETCGAYEPRPKKETLR